MPTTLTKATPTHTDTRERIEAMIAASERRLRREFVEAVAEVAEGVSLAEIERLLSEANVDEILVLQEAIAARLATRWVREYMQAAEDTAEFIGERLEQFVDFDRTNARAIREMRAHRARLVREFVEDQRETVTRAVVEGFRQIRVTEEDGVAIVREVAVNPRETARRFRDSIGLTAKQEQWVANYRHELESLDMRSLGRELRDRRFDGVVTRAIDRNEPLSRQKIDQLVDRYRARFIKYRSEVIARTEAIGAVQAGTQEMYRQAFQNGTLDGQDLERTWDTREDGRQRDSHESMDQQVRGIDEAFVSGAGNRLMYPGDRSAPASEIIQCRCVALVRFREAE